MAALSSSSSSSSSSSNSSSSSSSSGSSGVSSSSAACVKSPFQGCVVEGDLFEILGFNESTKQTEYWYGQCIGCLVNSFEVYLLERCADNPLIWHLSKEPQMVPWESINFHVSLSATAQELSPVSTSVELTTRTESRARKYGWQKLGFRMITDASKRWSGYFIKSFEEQFRTLQNRPFPIGEDDSEDEDAGTEVGSDEEIDPSQLEDIDERGFLRDLVAPESSKAEMWTRAPNDSAFAASTHAAVAQYAQWNPQTPGQQRMKQLIDAIEHRAALEESEKAFAQRASVQPFGPIGPTVT